MEDGRVLQDYGVRDSATIHVVIRRRKDCLDSSPVKKDAEEVAGLWCAR